MLLLLMSHCITEQAPSTNVHAEHFRLSLQKEESSELGNRVWMFSLNSN